ncbi:LppU/SCO3897 family protein [Catellatospora citrea]|uniref:Uncharacterized protein n=1 Tax=Catellatospora citrea TaxID=53366 RepID=A0A8J3KF05_9ACTN|nr:hypothetical protein [Catellatospora citrea]RKE08131.1 hypothetical protein C8E86_2975 [Catellatospora citrea]GIF98512.1 hypothetical protein Cci01nite_36060 [Catellatospora citrea]
MSEQVTPAVPEQETAEPSTAKSAAAGVGKKILGYGIAAAVVFGGGLAYKYISGDITIAKAGDCVNDFANVDDAKVVDCASADAKNKVVGVIESVSEADFDAKQQTLCEAFPTWEQIVWVGKKGGSGDSWCLEPLKK